MPIKKTTYKTVYGKNIKICNIEQLDFEEISNKDLKKWIKYYENIENSEFNKTAKELKRLIKKTKNSIIKDRLEGMYDNLVENRSEIFSFDISNYLFEEFWRRKNANKKAN